MHACKECGSTEALIEWGGRIQNWCRDCYRRHNRRYKRAKYGQTKRVNKRDNPVCRCGSRDMSESQIKHRSYKCKECVKNAWVAHVNFTYGSERARSRDRYRSLRERVVSKYGNKCSCCGIDKLKYLTIDHVNGDGGNDRTDSGSGVAIYRRLDKVEPDFDNYRVLCHNCNCAIGWFGMCPHVSDVILQVKRNYVLKKQVFNEYGATCNSCDESDIHFLSLDHVNGDGKSSRETHGYGSGVSFYSWLRARNFPLKDELQVLCMNCNMAKGTRTQLEVES